MDSPEMTTPRAKHRLDVDGRFAKIYEAGLMAVIKAVELCRQYAPVELFWVPGNHDPQTSYGILQTVWAYFMRDESVTVDKSPRDRKCYPYGNCAVGFTHGCDEPQKDLPRIFMDEFNTVFPQAKHKEIHIGHLHKKKELSFLSADSHGATTVRVIPSLCSTDAWHYRKGYIGKVRAAQSFLWHKDNGLLGTFYSYAD